MTNGENILSIIIPYKNTAEMLRNCLDSIGGARDGVEIIVVNDYSDKNVEEYRAITNDHKYSHIRFIDNDGEPYAGSARNLAMSKANSKWTIFVDADDHLLPDWYETLSPYFDRDNEVVFFSPVSENVLPIFPNRHLRYKERIDNYLDNPSSASTAILKYWSFPPWSKLYLTKFLRKHNIKFQNTITGNDNLFSAMVANNLKRFEATRKAFYCVSNQNPDSLTSYSQTREMYLQRRQAAIEAIEYLVQNATKKDLVKSNIINLQAKKCIVLSLIKLNSWKLFISDIRIFRKLLPHNELYYILFKIILKSQRLKHIRELYRFFRYRLTNKILALFGKKQGNCTQERNLDLSVIVPVYNVERYVIEALDSIYRQLPARSELVIVNDGSTDNSHALVSEWIEGKSHIKYICQRNGGLSKARNTGIDHASGEYTLFVDSDDYLHPDKLPTLLKTAKEESLDMLLFGGDIIIENEYTRNYMPMYDNRYCREEASLQTGRTMMSTLLQRKEPPFFLSNVYLYIFRSELMDRGRFRFEEGEIFEDIDFTLEMMYRSKRVRSVSDTVYCRRLRDNSIMAQNDTKIFKNRADIYMKYLRFFMRRKMPFDTHSTTLKDRYWNCIIKYYNQPFTLRNWLLKRRINRLTTKYLSLRGKPNRTIKIM